MWHWKKPYFLLIGYSSGADVLPFMAARLPQSFLDRMKLLALLGPSPSTDLEIHFTDFVSSRNRPASRPLVPELEKLAGHKVYCFYGSDDTGVLCPGLNPKLGKAIMLPGGHHFGGDYEKLAQMIMDLAEKD